MQPAVGVRAGPGHIGRTGQWFGKVPYRAVIGEVSRSGVQSVRSVQQSAVRAFLLQFAQPAGRPAEREIVG